jgi:hypothetical protein
MIHDHYKADDQFGEHMKETDLFKLTAIRQIK